MLKKNLFIISDKLDAYTPLFEMITREASFQTEVLTSAEFFSDAFKEEAHTYDPADIFFAFERSMFDTQKKTITEYF
ncbi:MAG TPA: hypothetical protein ENN69_01925, partial [Spirochaetia bacterium]|nr:hypothetical protein [Spirochaetia bacterium]